MAVFVLSWWFERLLFCGIVEQPACLKSVAHMKSYENYANQTTSPS